MEIIDARLQTNKLIFCLKIDLFFTTTRIMNKYQKTKEKINRKVADIAPFAKFVPLIKEVTEIHIKVTDIYGTAQHCKNIKKNFMERISLVNSAVNILQKREDLFTSHYYTSLQRLVRVLQNMIKFVK